MNYAKLLGRTVLVYWRGWRYLKCVRVKSGKCVGLKSIRVAETRYEGRDDRGANKWSYKGPKRTVTNDGFAIRGVLFRNKVIPVDTFCIGVAA